MCVARVGFERLGVHWENEARFGKRIVSTLSLEMLKLGIGRFVVCEWC